MPIQVTMTAEQLLVISQLLSHIRLGQKTIFGNAVTALAINLEEQFSDGIEFFQDKYGVPKITIEISDEEGMVFNIL